MYGNKYTYSTANEMTRIAEWAQRNGCPWNVNRSKNFLKHKIYADDLRSRRSPTVELSSDIC